MSSFHVPLNYSFYKHAQGSFSKEGLACLIPGTATGKSSGRICSDNSAPWMRHTRRQVTHLGSEWTRPNLPRQVRQRRVGAPIHSKLKPILRGKRKICIIFIPVFVGTCAYTTYTYLYIYNTYTLHIHIGTIKPSPSRGGPPDAGR